MSAVTAKTTRALMATGNPTSVSKATVNSMVTATAKVKPKGHRETYGYGDMESNGGRYDNGEYGIRNTEYGIMNTQAITNSGAVQKARNTTTTNQRDGRRMRGKKPEGPPGQARPSLSK